MTSVAAVLSLEKLYCKSPATFKHLQVGRRNKIHTAPLCFTGCVVVALLLKDCRVTLASSELPVEDKGQQSQWRSEQ